MNTGNIIEIVAKLIHESEKILFITGAGISADSGLPTYRGIGGLYNDKHTEENISIEDALSGIMMEKRPEITWKYLWQIGSACHKAKPNRAHEVITLIQETKPNTWVLTQNIDGLHNAAKTQNLIEIHGNAFSLHYTKCGKEKKYDQLIAEFQNEINLPPTCSYCNGIIRPDVVLFGEMLPTKALEAYYSAINDNLDLIISIGTSGIFPYIAEPVKIANYHSKPTIEINPTQTDISHLFTYQIEMKAAEAMDKIWNAFKQLRTTEAQPK